MPKIFFYIRNNKILNPKVVKAAFDEVLSKNGRYSLDINKANKRTILQNSYFHGVVVPLVFEGLRAIGYNEVKDVHDAKAVIKAIFLKKKIENPENGDIIEIIRDTSSLTTIEMMQLWEDVTQWASQYLGVTIPAPNSQATIEY